MEIKNDKHRHEGYANWHPISQKHKKNLHDIVEEDPTTEEVVVHNFTDIIVHGMSLIYTGMLESTVMPIRLSAKSFFISILDNLNNNEERSDWYEIPIQSLLDIGAVSSGLRPSEVNSISIDNIGIDGTGS